MAKVTQLKLHLHYSEWVWRQKSHSYNLYHYQQQQKLLHTLFNDVLTFMQLLVITASNACMTQTMFLAKVCSFPHANCKECGGASFSFTTNLDIYNTKYLQSIHQPGHLEPKYLQYIHQPGHLEPKYLQYIHGHLEPKYLQSIHQPGHLEPKYLQSIHGHLEPKYLQSIHQPGHLEYLQSTLPVHLAFNFPFQTFIYLFVCLFVSLLNV